MNKQIVGSISDGCRQPILLHSGMCCGIFRELHESPKLFLKIEFRFYAHKPSVASPPREYGKMYEKIGFIELGGN